MTTASQILQRTSTRPRLPQCNPGYQESRLLRASPSKHTTPIPAHISALCMRSLPAYLFAPVLSVRDPETPTLVHIPPHMRHAPCSRGRTGAHQNR